MKYTHNTQHWTAQQSAHNIITHCVPHAHIQIWTGRGGRVDRPFREKKKEIGVQIFHFSIYMLVMWITFKSVNQSVETSTRANRILLNKHTIIIAVWLFRNICPHGVGVCVRVDVCVYAFVSAIRFLAFFCLSFSHSFSIFLSFVLSSSCSGRAVPLCSVFDSDANERSWCIERLQRHL